MISYEEAIKSINELIKESDNLRGFTYSEYPDAYYFIQQHKPPTLEDVKKAWKEIEPEFKYRDKAVENNGIRILFPNGIYYQIDTKQVYSNRKVFSMNVEQTLNAINLTIQYLKATENGCNSEKQLNMVAKEKENE